LKLGGRFRAALVAGAASLFLLGTALAGTAMADQTPTTQTASTSHTHQLHGVVKTAPAAGSTTFILTTERYGDVTVSFAGDAARGRGHGRGEARAHVLTTTAELKAGDRVVVQGHTSIDGKSFVARRVHVLPTRSAAAHPTHLAGTIANVSTANGTTTLSVKLVDGTTQSVTVSADTKLHPEGKTLADLTVGTKVTVISRNGTATGVVVMSA
jgi:hypothetical protein